ncbi:MAG: MinD/ParA family protein [Candidatus Hydrogenedentota bacterium]
MVDQAQQLRKLMWNSHNAARVIAVTSGKGGVGKSNTSVNLAIALAQQSCRTILLDADLGLANVEVLMGFNAVYTLQDVIDGDRTIREVLVRAPGGIYVVPGTSGLAQVADLPTSARHNVLKGIAELQQMADFIIVDTMAGVGQNAVGFVLAADEVLLVTTPEPSAIVDAYTMLKTIYNNREDAVIRLIVNMAACENQGKAVAAKLANVARQYLGRNLSYLGYVPRDTHVSQAVMQSTPFMLAYPAAPATRSIQQIVAHMLHQQGESEPKKETFFRRFAQSLGIAS